LRPRQASAARTAVTRLQREVGNQGLLRLLQSGVIQAKLTIGPADDEHEREADRVADAVMRMPDPAPGGGLQRSSAGVQRMCAECEEEQLQRFPIRAKSVEGRKANIAEEDRPAIQTDAMGPAVPRVSSRVESVVASSLGHGREIPASSRRFFESRFNADLSSVRIHSDAGASAVARELRARAFTAGSDIFFADGQYRPESADGRRLLGHELTHVLQQRAGSVPSVQRQPAPATSPANAPQEYVPQVGAPERKRAGVKPEELGRLDLDEIYQRREVLRTRVEEVARELELDPGFLAANLFAEVSDPTVWSRTSGEVASEVLGLDDWFDPAVGRQIKKIIKEHPALGFRFSDVTATGENWDVSTEKAGAGEKPRGTLPARKAVIAIGLYIKASENMLKTRLSKKGLIFAFNVLTPEERLTVLRLTFNAGIVYGEGLVRKLFEGGDIPRTGKTTRDTKNAPRTAVLHMARAVHLSQVIFGRPASEYRPDAGSVQERIDALKEADIREAIKRAQRQHKVGRFEFPPPML
jgi:hypothetical protein